MGRKSYELLSLNHRHSGLLDFMFTLHKWLLAVYFFRWKLFFLEWTCILVESNLEWNALCKNMVRRAEWERIEATLTLFSLSQYYSRHRAPNGFIISLICLKPDLHTGLKEPWSQENYPTAKKANREVRNFNVLRKSPFLGRQTLQSFWGVLTDLLD